MARAIEVCWVGRKGACVYYLLQFTGCALLLRVGFGFGEPAAGVAYKR
jgi:hypothetical protein